MTLISFVKLDISLYNPKLLTQKLFSRFIISRIQWIIIFFQSLFFVFPTFSVSLRKDEIV